MDHLLFLSITIAIALRKSGFHQLNSFVFGIVIILKNSEPSAAFSL
jgi:hypothetical protein